MVITWQVLNASCQSISKAELKGPSYEFPGCGNTETQRDEKKATCQRGVHVSFFITLIMSGNHSKVQKCQNHKSMHINSSETVSSSLACRCVSGASEIRAECGTLYFAYSVLCITR